MIFQPDVLLTHTDPMSISHFYMSVWACTTNGTLQWIKMPASKFICGSHEISQPILTLTPKNYHHVHFIMYIFYDTSRQPPPPPPPPGKPWTGDIPQRKGSHRTRKNSSVM